LRHRDVIISDGEIGNADCLPTDLHGIGPLFGPSRVLVLLVLLVRKAKINARQS
jgi:hypothetical protein